MSFPGNSRTLTDTVPSSNFESFQVSDEEFSTMMKSIDDFTHDVMMKNLPTKVCRMLELRNSSVVKPLSLDSKESKYKISKLTEKARGFVYQNHAIIYLLYIPTVLESTHGLMSIKLFNSNTQEHVDIDTDAIVSEACVYVTRWPRSIPASEKGGLHLLVSAVSPTVKQNAVVGQIFPMWDDSVSRKMRYEKEYPTLKFPVEKSTASMAVKDMEMLKALTNSRMLAGVGAIDIAPAVISNHTEAKKPVTVSLKPTAPPEAVVRNFDPVGKLPMDVEVQKEEGLSKPVVIVEGEASRETLFHGVASSS